MTGVEDRTGAYLGVAELALGRSKIIRPGDFRTIKAPSGLVDVRAALGDVAIGCEPPVLRRGLLST